jgi:hypothetical protein
VADDVNQAASVFTQRDALTGFIEDVWADGHPGAKSLLENGVELVHDLSTSKSINRIKKATR